MHIEFGSLIIDDHAEQTTADGWIRWDDEAEDETKSPPPKWPGFSTPELWSEKSRTLKPFGLSSSFNPSVVLFNFSPFHKLLIIMT